MALSHNTDADDLLTRTLAQATACWSGVPNAACSIFRAAAR